MAQESTNTNIDNNSSFLDNKRGPSFHIKDALFLLLRNLHWLLLFAALGAAVGIMKVKREVPTYASSAKIMIRSSSGISNADFATREAAVKSAFAGERLYNSSVNNEIMILTSKTTMLDAARNLKLNVSYVVKTKFMHRDKDLYTESPIIVDFIDCDEEKYVGYTVTPLNDKKVAVSGNGFTTIKMNLGDTVSTPLGTIAVHSTWFYLPEYFNVPISVSHQALTDVAERYRGSLSVARDDTRNAVVNIYLNDVSPVRAADVINEVIKVYNDDAINDKKRIINETYAYINERVEALNVELGTQETALANFKQENRLVDLNLYGQTYINNSIQSSEALEKVRQQYSTAKYLAQFNKNNDNYSLIPPGIVVEDNQIMNVVSQYNDNVLKLSKYDATAQNPVVKGILQDQNNLRTNLNTLLDVYISLLESRMQEAKRIADQASGTA